MAPPGRPVRPRSCPPGARLQVLDGRVRPSPRLVPQVLDEHPELRAPIAHVVQAQHLRARELQEAGERVANDCGAEVPHVHLLGDIRAGEVHHGAAAAAGGRGRPGAGAAAEEGAEVCGEPAL